MHTQDISPVLRVYVLIPIAAVFLTKALAVPDILHTNPATHRIVDTAGRERFFHGVNVVVKGPPWMPRTDKFDSQWSFCEEDMKLLQSWGLNAIRYGMMWPGVEPVEGKYNDTYLSASKDIVNKAAEYGIYTLLDMHQDVLSEKFCGEGIPDWAVNDMGPAREFPLPLLSLRYKYDNTTGYPTKEDCGRHNWEYYYFAHATCVAFQALYDNSNGLTDKMAAFWGRVAQEFVDNEYILGYEVINEPWAGDIFANPELLLPILGEADKKNLAPFYEVLNKEIRKYDNEHSFYFTSVTFDELGVGFEQVPGGPEYQNRSVLAWHFYFPPQLIERLSFHERQKDIERLGCAGFLTEFSLTSSRLPTTLEEADNYLLSWMGWDYKAYLPITGSDPTFWKNGTLDKELVKKVSRTYAQAVAGITKEMHFDPNTKEFTLKYTTTKSCTSTVTEIFLNEHIHYKNGYTVMLEITGADDGGRWFSPKENYVHVQHNVSLSENSSVTVIIKPKSLSMWSELVALATLVLSTLALIVMLTCLFNFCCR